MFFILHLQTDIKIKIPHTEEESIYWTNISWLEVLNGGDPIFELFDTSDEDTVKKRHFERRILRPLLYEKLGIQRSDITWRTSTITTDAYSIFHFRIPAESEEALRRVAQEIVDEVEHIISFNTWEAPLIRK